MRILNKKYKEFSKAAGLPEQRERMAVYHPTERLKETLNVNAGVVTGIIPKGAEISSVRLIAGGVSDKPVNVAEHLSKNYGGEPLKWLKMGGIIKTDHFKYDVHWFELNGVHYEEKVKGVRKQ